MNNLPLFTKKLYLACCHSPTVRYKDAVRVCSVSARQKVICFCSGETGGEPFLWMHRWLLDDLSLCHVPLAHSGRF